MVRSARILAASLAFFSAPGFAATKKVPPPPPITFDRPAPVIPTVTLPPSSEGYGDWTVRGSGGVYIAATTNSVNAVFGSICDKDGCTAFVNPLLDCEVGAKYPVLINSPAGSFTPSLLCEKVDDRRIYSLPIEGNVADSMSIGGVIGFAFPMESGEFKVQRFSLTGAARAAARAGQLANAKPPTKSQKASDNQTL